MIHPAFNMVRLTPEDLAIHRRNAQRSGLDTFMDTDAPAWRSDIKERSAAYRAVKCPGLLRGV